MALNTNNKVQYCDLSLATFLLRLTCTRLEPKQSRQAGLSDLTLNQFFHFESLPETGLLDQKKNNRRRLNLPLRPLAIG
jgi:hypothetical protein